MSLSRLAHLFQSLEELFPERHLYVRSGGQIRAFVLTTRNQLVLAGALAGAALWTGIATAAVLVGAVSTSHAEAEIARNQARYERLIADRQARLDSLFAQMNTESGSVAELAETVEKRHAALALLLADARSDPGAAEALAPALNKAAAMSSGDPVRRVEMVRLSQDQLVASADAYAKSRAERLRLAFRLAGLSHGGYGARPGSLGGPLIEAKDPRALAAILDVDEPFAERIQQAAASLTDAKALGAAAQALPLGRPTATSRSSSFGVRLDPFTRRPAFHSGLDFSGGFATPVTSTAPGVVAFTGVRSGYGNTVEIDHGRGFKTRYAHLSSIAVKPGQRIVLGQRLGAMGSTGRSTGVHLHYEVWVNGRAQNPDRFLKAGDHVRQAS